MNNAANEVSFFLNGKAVTIKEAAPDLMLIDYLRSPSVALPGPKKPCGQGGCGGCTVILSQWNEARNVSEHRAINSCLRPVCALGGLVITTVEGTGAVRKPDPAHLQHTLTASRAAAPFHAYASPMISDAIRSAKAKLESVRETVRAAAEIARLLPDIIEKIPHPPSERSHKGMNPVAHRLALNNGSQCGYCSVGFVMNMSEFIINHPKATKKEIEAAFDGNLCRCTGYRTILTGMKTFASDWDEKDEQNRMPCRENESHAAQLPAGIEIPFPAEAHSKARPVTIQGVDQKWLTPTTLAELASILHENRGQKIRLIHGNTSFGIYKEEYLETKLFVDIRLIPNLLRTDKRHGSEIVVAAREFTLLRRPLR
jgi:xanthine dehydrogenase/oxidase